LSGTPSRQTWKTNSADQTRDLGADLGRSLIGGLTIGLVGPLGSGKTQLVKGIASGNGIDDVRKVTSPTFTLVHAYQGRLTLYHVDVYRLSGPAELETLGFEEFARPDSAVVIEWADRVRPIVPEDALWIELEPTGSTNRTLSFEATGQDSADCLDALRAARR
jgi:tRNA threonylcarbamoyladenosine biosynthesis protein TsaE